MYQMTEYKLDYNIFMYETQSRHTPNLIFVCLNCLIYMLPQICP